MLKKLHDEETSASCLAERGFLWKLEGGCHVPVGVITELKGDNRELVHLHGRILSLDGSQVVEGEITGPRENAWNVGVDLATRLLKEGGDKILAELNQQQAKSAPSK